MYFENNPIGVYYSAVCYGENQSVFLHTPDHLGRNVRDSRVVSVCDYLTGLVFQVERP